MADLLPTHRIWLIPSLISKDSSVGIYWSNKKYQFYVENAALICMVCLMGLFAVAFLFTPNMATFQRLENLGILISPKSFGIGALLFSLGYLLIGSVFKNRSNEFRQWVFIVSSLPVLFYFLAVGIDQIRRGLFITIIAYIGIYFIIILLSFAIFRSYHRLLEIASVLLLIVLMGVMAVTFAFMPNSAIFYGFNRIFGLHLVPFSLAMLSFFCAIGFMTMPFIKKSHPLLKRVLFSVFACPVLIYALMVFCSLVLSNVTTTIIGGLSLLTLFALISLLGVALYRNRDSHEIPVAR